MADFFAKHAESDRLGRRQSGEVFSAGYNPSMWRTIDRLDHQITSWMSRNGPLFARVALAVVFIWFGLLKPFHASPADDLVRRTVYWVNPDWFIPLLGWWEVAIGVCMLFRPLIRVAVFRLMLQMPGTMLPLFILPDVCWVHFPTVPTLEGQYIIKNVVLIAAAIVAGGTARQKRRTQSLTR